MSKAAVQGIAPESAPLPRSRSTSAEARGLHGLQGMAGFVLGGLMALVASMAPAVWSDDPAISPARYLGYMAGGAMGGVMMVWGYPRKKVVTAAALGFGVSFLAPAFLAAPQVDALMTISPDAYGTGTYLSCLFAFGVSYGLAGAVGMALAVPGAFLRAGAAFAFSGAVGGLITAFGPSLGGPDHLAGMFRMILLMMLGHVVAFTLGGWLSGVALQSFRRKVR